MPVPPPWRPPSLLKKIAGPLVLLTVIGGSVFGLAYAIGRATSQMPKEWKVDGPRLKKPFQLESTDAGD